VIVRSAVLALVGDDQQNHEQMLIIALLFVAAGIAFALIVWHENRHGGRNPD
jgi:hypothetical protein